MESTGLKLKDSDRTVCEVWTRVMGYYRPTTAFNKGKQSEYKDRVCFKENSGCAECVEKQAA